MLCHSYVYLTPIPVTCDQNPLTDSLPIPWPHGVCPLAFLSHPKAPLHSKSVLSFLLASSPDCCTKPPIAVVAFPFISSATTEETKGVFCGGARDYPEPFLWSQQQSEVELLLSWPRQRRRRFLPCLRQCFPLTKCCILVGQFWCGFQFRFGCEFNKPRTINLFA